ncbi:hypothetical protein LCGC14_0500530 [marine sediment metagenome]|uniref:Right handed beta helix domain-containing protein n=1 Tax=marine sediment metagenome TaxID=412755 RepID=A0A0F9S979_9ZZZZ
MAGTNVQSKAPPYYTGGLSQVLRPGANQGDVFYVDGTGGAGNDGRTPLRPLATITSAIALCTNQRNDTIVILDYFAAGGEAWPIVCDKEMVSIIGVPGAGAMWPQVNPVGDNPSFSVTALGVEICNLACHGGATAGAIQVDATVWGTEIHHCWFGETGTAQDGIRVPAGGDAVYLKIWGCRFGIGLTRDGVRIDHNATRGMIGCPGLEPNWFRGVGGIAINCNNQFAQGGIFDNRISMLADTAGGAITIAGTNSGIHIDGNSATFGETAAAHNNPYLDNAGADANEWGYNRWSETITVPG